MSGLRERLIIEHRWSWTVAVQAFGVFQGRNTRSWRYEKHTHVKSLISVSISAADEHRHLFQAAHFKLPLRIRLPGLLLKSPSTLDIGLHRNSRITSNTCSRVPILAATMTHRNSEGRNSKKATACLALGVLLGIVALARHNTKEKKVKPKRSNSTAQVTDKKSSKRR